MRCFATAAGGLEEVLTGELSVLGMREVERRPGGVAFTGARRDLYRACLWLRTATRVFVELGTFNSFTHDRLYAGVRRIPWEEWLDPDCTLAVDCRLGRANQWIDHSGFTVLRVKDALCDRLRETTGRRPDIDKERPDVRVHARIGHNRAAIYLDAAGTPLHKRGWRVTGHPAHLRETLAAGIVLLSGWDRQSPLFDPLCGSGTLLIEGALLAAGIAPGIAGDRAFACQRWRDFDPGLWQSLRQEARAAVRRDDLPPIAGSDRDPRAVAAARANADAAGVGHLVTIEQRAIDAAQPPPGTGTLVTNPPYGERLDGETDLAPLYAALGTLLKQRCKGWRTFVLAGNRELTAALHLKATRRYPLRNGPIDCRLLHYDLY
ncbi:MAG: THUMP domain-containing protein [Nitrospirota bacterium]|jgi:putative N6-adenine-specific DNA methylase